MPEKRHKYRMLVEPDPAYTSPFTERFNIFNELCACGCGHKFAPKDVVVYRLTRVNPREASPLAGIYFLRGHEEKLDQEIEREAKQKPATDDGLDTLSPFGI